MTDRPSRLGLPRGFVPAKVYMDGPEFLAWLRGAWTAGYLQAASDHAGATVENDWALRDPYLAKTFEEWVRECLGTDSVPAAPPESPNP